DGSIRSCVSSGPRYASTHSRSSPSSSTSPPRSPLGPPDAKGAAEPFRVSGGPITPSALGLPCGVADDEMTLEPLTLADHPPSGPCLAYMTAHGYDAGMAVYRAVVSPAFMARTKAERPDVANTLQLLVGPFGIVAPPGLEPFRVAVVQVGDVVLDV